MPFCFHTNLPHPAVLVLGLAVLCGALPVAAHAQQQARPDSAQSDTVGTDTPQTRPPADSLRTAPRPDSLAQDAPPGAGGPGAGRPDAAGDAVRFSARDSLIIVFGEDDEGDVGTLYGNAEVQQENAKLSAYEVQILFDRSELRATGPPEGMPVDTMGLPRFQRGEGEAFTGRELSFNMETKRGRIVEARTAFQEGYVQGEAVRVEEDSTLFVRGGVYTTCNCPPGETPSYSLRSRKMKVQGKWVYTGPIMLFLYNIPTPFVLPFALLPSTAGRRGGIIPPSYGEDDRRGFFLRDFGYYWPISDYMDVLLTGSVWSRGSWALSPSFRYKRRYHYDGALHVDYVRTLAGDVVDNDYLNSTSASIKWSHSQQFTPSQAPNASSLYARVNLASETYRRVLSDDFNDNVTQSTSSSVNFRKQWNDGDQRLTLKLTQSQNLTTGNAELTLPSLEFDQRSIQPFKHERRGPGEEERWYEKITTSYDGSLTNNFRYRPLADSTLINRGDSSAVGIDWYDALFSQEAYRRATGDETQRFDFSAEHRIPVRASFNLPRYQLNITPSFNYREEWFTSTTRLEPRPDTTLGSDGQVENISYDTVELDEPGFFAAREFNLGVGASTTFYGLFPLRAGPLQGLRHTVQPDLSFSYSPNLNADFFGRTRTIEIPQGDSTRTVRYNILTGNEVRGSTERRNINFGVRNTFETKEVRIDSTGAEQEETLRLLSLSANSSYNFAADSLRLADFRFNADFPVLQDKFNINADLNFTFSPYVYDAGGRQRPRLVLDESGFLPARLSDFDISISTDFQGGSQSARRGTGRQRRAPLASRAGVDPTTGGAPQVPGRVPEDIPGRPLLRQGLGQYANFDIPWSLRLRFTYGFTNRGRFEGRNVLLNIPRFDFNLTPKWKVSGRTGFDFTEGEITATRLNITRDFECWQMAFSWVPFGPRQSYSFNLYVKSDMLRDLLNLRIPREGIKDRFSGVLSGVTR